MGQIKGTRPVWPPRLLGSDRTSRINVVSEVWIFTREWSGWGAEDQKESGGRPGAQREEAGVFHVWTAGREAGNQQGQAPPPVGANRGP